jgi:hypothetical protein
MGRVAGERIRLWCFFTVFFIFQLFSSPFVPCPPGDLQPMSKRMDKNIIHDIESSMGYKREKINHSLFLNEKHDIKSSMPYKT